MWKYVPYIINNVTQPAVSGVLCLKWLMLGWAVNGWMDLYLYSTFLVLMTTQSSLQYSFTFTQSHTHSHSASISSTLLFYEAQFRVQHLAQGHFGMQIFFFWEDWGSNCRPSGWRTTHTMVQTSMWTTTSQNHITDLCRTIDNKTNKWKDVTRQDKLLLPKLENKVIPWYNPITVLKGKIPDIHDIYFLG